MKAIASRDNPRFKRLRRWATQPRARRSDNVLLLDGLHLIVACLDAGGRLDEVIVSARGAAHPEIAAWLAAHPAVACFQLSDAMFAELAATDSPSGILGIASPTAAAEAPDPAQDCVLLDGIQDPGNVGTLLRTAAAAGIRQALLGPGCADPWAPRTLRAGQGAQFEMRIHEAGDLAGFLAAYRGTSLVTRLDASRSLYATPLEGPLAWVFGAEGQGVSEAVSRAATFGVHIPMPGKIESLNVAAAAAVCLFEMVRRRTA